MPEIITAIILTENMHSGMNRLLITDVKFLPYLVVDVVENSRDMIFELIRAASV